MNGTKLGRGKKLIGFDLDDTLAATKQPITPRIARLLRQLAEHYEVAVITGGPYKQVQQNVIDRLGLTPEQLARFYFMPVNGSQYYHYDAASQKWQNDQYIDDLPAEEQKRIANVLESAARKLGYWVDDPVGDIIDYRGTQVTYSALGQFADPKAKYAWDPAYEKRKKMYQLVSRDLSEYRVLVNGNTSIDVTQPGYDKGFGMVKLMDMLGLDKQDILFFGDQLQEGGNDRPVIEAGIEAINVANWEETAVAIEQLIETAGGEVKSSRTSLLAQLIEQFKSARPSSREDLLEQFGKLLAEYQPQLIDTHNTTSFIYTFSVKSKRYGLKLEYGEATALESEAKWYDFVPAPLRTHHVASFVGAKYTFVLTRWLENARTLEEVAIMNEDRDTGETMDLVIAALNQIKYLFNSNPTVSLEAVRGNSYFWKKYQNYNREAKDFPYLQKLIDSPAVRVNGRNLAGPNAIVESVQNNPKLLKYLEPDRAGIIHGDPQFDNILIEDDKVSMVDPKGIDPLPIEYDTGRVIWSLTGWNAIVRGEFELSHDDDGYHLNYQKRSQYTDGLARLRQYFSPQEYHRAVYSSAMQYLTRVSHAKHPDEATALYLRGLELFQDLFDELGEPSPLASTE